MEPAGAVVVRGAGYTIPPGTLPRRGTVLLVADGSAELDGVAADVAGSGIATGTPLCGPAPDSDAAAAGAGAPK